MSYVGKEPTAPEYPIPTPPGFPPVPSPPCFKLGNLFSIDCPPNNNKALQTTHFTRGSNHPTAVVIVIICLPQQAAHP
jgi:hypothetical protein